MQVIKGGWVGQTFALAKLNDSSGGKKSKNRHSKEERKGMVETFIKRYQASNNGNFPSLRLTQKEVGGSFYTVREIFREIIQENRVLAPPKLPPGEQNMENLDSFLEHYPLGSVSVDPHIHMVPPKDTQTLLNEYEFRREKVLNSIKIAEMNRGSLDYENIINGSINHTTAKNEEFEEQKHTELDGQKDEVKELEACEAQMRSLSEDLVVETFPLRPVLNAVYNVEEKSSEKDESFVHDEINLFDNSTEMVDTKSEDNFKPIEIVTTENHFSTDENQFDVNTIADIKFEDMLPAEEKVSSSPNGISSQNLNGKNSSNSLQKSTFEETNSNTNKSDIRFNVTTQKQPVGATLNRINLESWEASSSKKSEDEEINPIVSFIKSLVTAFVKFWSE